jgi:hypothetical protein
VLVRFVAVVVDACELLPELVDWFALGFLEALVCPGFLGESVHLTRRYAKHETGRGGSGR